MPSGSYVSPSKSGSAYGGGPASAQSASRTKGRHLRPNPSALHPYTPCTALAMRIMMGRPRHAPIRIPYLQVEEDTGPPPKETRVIHPRVHRKLPQRRIRGSMPGPCCTSLGFFFPSERAHRSLRGFDDPPIGYRSWALLSRSSGSCSPRYSCTVRQIPADTHHHIFGG